MRKFTGISSVLLLLFYSVVFLHNILPHTHCEAPLQKGIEDSHHHSDDHGHHHHHLAKDESGNLLDYILGFLGELDHEEQGNGDVELFLGEDAIAPVNLTDGLTVLAVPVEKNAALIAPAEDFVEHRSKPPNISPQYSNDSSPLRGPPSFS